MHFELLCPIPSEQSNSLSTYHYAKHNTDNASAAPVGKHPCKQINHQYCNNSTMLAKEKGRQPAESEVGLQH